jgi:hypothetical protein
MLIGPNVYLGTCEQDVIDFFESADERLTRDGGKSLHKFFECFSARQAVEQNLDGRTRAAGSAPAFSKTAL